MRRGTVLSKLYDQMVLAGAKVLSFPSWEDASNSFYILINKLKKFKRLADNYHKMICYRFLQVADFWNYVSARNCYRL